MIFETIFKIYCKINKNICNAIILVIFLINFNISHAILLFIMAGEELRNILFINKIEIKSLAKQLGMSPQSLSQMFTANDVKSGLLEKIAEVLNKDMTFFYPVPETTVNTIHHVRQGNNSQLVGTGSASMDNTEVISRLMDELSALRKQNEKLMEKLLAQ